MEWLIGGIPTLFMFLALAKAVGNEDIFTPRSEKIAVSAVLTVLFVLQAIMYLAYVGV